MPGFYAIRMDDGRLEVARAIDGKSGWLAVPEGAVEIKPCQSEAGAYRAIADVLQKKRNRGDDESESE